MHSDEYYMLKALKMAEKAEKLGEIPVGVVIVEKNKIIAKAYNERDSKNIVTKHAEMIAIEKANRYKKNWRLNECKMYVTLEPCMMCSATIEQARIQEVIYAASIRDINLKKRIEEIKINKRQISGKEIIGKCEKQIDDFFKVVRQKTN